MTRRDWLLVSAGCLFAASIPVAGLTYKKLRGRRPPPGTSEEEQNVIELANAARLEVQLPRLPMDPLLSTVARAHADTMARDKALEPPDRGWLEQSLQEVGYPVMIWGLAIDLVYAMSLPEAFANWMKTDATRDEVLSPYYADLGAGVVRDSSTGAYYVTLMFGKKKRMS